VGRGEQLMVQYLLVAEALLQQADQLVQLVVIEYTHLHLTEHFKHHILVELKYWQLAVVAVAHPLAVAVVLADMYTKLAHK
tara:strand:- start:446 stop:688 length:243 start_codon:yes stop_codon:yes gene_type:complete